jgi:hypothetical protein
MLLSFRSSAGLALGKGILAFELQTLVVVGIPDTIPTCFHTSTADRLNDVTLEQDVK